MAVEDGAVIGLLLGSLQEKGLSTDANKRSSQLANMFELYEVLRKTRTETIVQGSAATRDFYHLSDGPEQEQRDKELAQLPESEWKARSNYHWGDAAYQKRMLGFDVLADAKQEFETWYSKQKPEAHL
jgi:salicylate hydroxylase